MILPLTAKEVRTSVFCLRAANFVGRERTFVAQFCRAFNRPVGRRNTSVGINPTRTELTETGGDRNLLHQPQNDYGHGGEQDSSASDANARIRKSTAPRRIEEFLTAVLALRI